jgi:hypothetical protein
MKITIDTENKTAVVHVAATFEEIIDFIKMVCPVGWNSYKLTCENVPMQGFSSGFGITTLTPNYNNTITTPFVTNQCKQ